MSKRILIVGAGFYGSVLARELTDAGCSCKLIERREQIGGNCFTRYNEEADCHQHVYGPHIFHTNSEEVWRYLTRFTKFNNFVNRPKSMSAGKLYSLPINLMTLYQVYGVNTPEEAKATIEKVRIPCDSPNNLEDWCLSQVGPEIYELLIKGYTMKQWRRDPKELPASIIKRLPIRFNFDDNYFRDRYQGIPEEGYTKIFERMLEGIDVELGVDFLADRDEWIRRFDHVVFTGPIDAFFNYTEGTLEYRSLRFESEILDTPDFQGNALINYGETQVPYTRIAEHKHFDLSYSKDKTLITREYSQEWQEGMERYYPVGTQENLDTLRRYQLLAKEAGLPVTFGGRLGQYKYFDMHQVIAAALTKAKRFLQDGFEVSDEEEN
ncbi:UDP-galactopyranose mutase [Pelagicoccus albus]|uniref:UDP-galactopyranose mutase n=1 Tax=Pelagicoccus albus TaxID=415222 RepID=A0A7X1B779_9BACT|nr:UDP-galactopyranose mutase [Pelagicoccus albus]MBC2606940.1 UDP-galactopyranose mutase [Pelagicoccus albus]